MCIIVAWSCDYFYKAVVEEKANGCRAGHRRCFELLGCDGSDKLFELRTWSGIVINGELAALMSHIGGGFGWGNCSTIVQNKQQENGQTSECKRRRGSKDRHGFWNFGLWCSLRQRVEQVEVRWGQIALVEHIKRLRTREVKWKHMKV